MPSRITILLEPSLVPSYPPSCHRFLSQWSKPNHYWGPNRSNCAMEGFCDSAYHNGWCVSWLGSLPFFPVIVAILFGDQEHVPDDLSGLFSSLPISGPSFLHLPLVYFTSNKEIMGEHVNAKWNIFLGYLVGDCLNHLKFQFDCDDLYQ